MNPVDVAAVAILVVSAVLGLARGFVREVLGLAAWIGAVAGAFALFPTVDPACRALAQRVGAAPVVGDVAAALVGFVVLLLVFSAVAHALARLVRATPFGGIDRLLGLGFGAARGALILVVAYVLAGLAVPPADWPDAVRRARTTPLAFAGAAWAVTLVPPFARPHVANPAPIAGPASGEKV